MIKRFKMPLITHNNKNPIKRVNPMTLAETIYQKSLELPDEKAIEVIDFIDFLKSRAGLLKESPNLNAPSHINEVAGCLAYQGKAKTLEEMDNAIQQGIISEWGQHDSH
jgi:hypothetical protein